MRRCNICGRKATIYSDERWWCEKHYLLVKKKGNTIHNTVNNHQGKHSRIDLGLTKV